MIFFKKALGWLFTFVLFVWGGVKLTLDYVGRSTFLDDWDQLVSEIFPDGLAWLLTTPWWAPAAIGAVLSCFLIWINWPTLNPSMEMEPQLNRVVTDNSWASGHQHLSIEFAACALGGVTVDSFAHSDRARAIARELLTLVKAGKIETTDHFQSRERSGVTVLEDGEPQYPKVEGATMDTLISVESLSGKYLKNRPDLNIKWIKTGRKKSHSGVTIEVNKATNRI